MLEVLFQASELVFEGWPLPEKDRELVTIQNALFLLCYGVLCDLFFGAMLIGNGQPPSVQFFTMDVVIFNNAYDLVEHMQQLKEAIRRGGPAQEDITRLCNSIDYDVDKLRSHLRDIKAEIKQMRGGEPLSQQTEIQKREQVDE